MSDIEKVKQLRKSTGAGFKDCNSALKESKGDLDKAAEILRVKGIAKASKKMSRSATEGVVVTSGDEKKMSLIEVNCETDFVAKNDDFIHFVKELSDLNNDCSADLKKNLFSSQTKAYLSSFKKLLRKKNTELIEIHNSNIFLNYDGNKIHNYLKKNKFILQKRYRFPFTTWEDRIYLNKRILHSEDA